MSIHAYQLDEGGHLQERPLEEAVRRWKGGEGAFWIDAGPLQRSSLEPLLDRLGVSEFLKTRCFRVGRSRKSPEAAPTRWSIESSADGVTKPGSGGPSDMPVSPGDRFVLDLQGFEQLLLALRNGGHELVGPTVRDGAIVLDHIDAIGDLPRGMGDEQRPGYYRLRPRDDDQLFGFAVPVQPWKRHFLPARLDLVQIRKKGSSLEAEDATSPAAPIAVIGARPCEVAAMRVQDRVLREGPYPDHDYASRREAAFVLAVNCGAPADTCFCTSMGTGPRADSGFDLAATELAEPTHRFLIEVGTEKGAQALAGLALTNATADDTRAADAVIRGAVNEMGLGLDSASLPERLLANLESPRWDEVAERCLGCGSCTFACPTCFCTTVEDTTDLGGEVATRTRTWDSCFSADFAYIHGGSVRPTLRDRYRQWHTHKLATWVEQFGTSGCVGCGRCTTWCPVGIDLVAEATAVGENRG